MPEAKYKKPKKYVGKMTEARPLKKKPIEIKPHLKARYGKKPKGLDAKTIETFNKLAKSAKTANRKSLARKVVSKLGLTGKAAVGLSIGYDIIRGVKPQKQGVTCNQGHRTIKDGGKTYCISNAKIKKAKMKTTNKAVVDMKSKR